MARRFRPLGQVCASALLASLFALLPALRTASGAPTPSPAPVRPAPAPRAAPLSVPPTPPPAAHPSPTAPPKPPKPDEWTEARHLFEQLSPDQKNKFLDNLDQWKAMSPEEQELFRDRELFRREKIAQEIKEAINKSGLKLDDDQREVFALRYTQERRKIEEALHKEMDQKRQSMVGDMLSRLKVEFTGTPAGKATAP
jgi:hypothetical protein